MRDEELQQRGLIGLGSEQLYCNYSAEVIRRTNDICALVSSATRHYFSWAILS